MSPCKQSKKIAHKIGKCADCSANKKECQSYGICVYSPQFRQLISKQSADSATACGW
jgi:hypothetical protein